MALLALVCAGTAFAPKHTRRHASSSTSPKASPASPKKDLAKKLADCDSEIHELKGLIALAVGKEKRKLEVKLSEQRKKRDELV